jgi:hypothetical protein
MTNPVGEFPSPFSRGGVRGGAVAAAARSKALHAARRAPPPAPPRKDGEGSAAPSVLTFAEIA